MDGVKIYYNEVGEGFVFVLIYGGGLGVSGWFNYN